MKGTTIAAMVLAAAAASAATIIALKKAHDKKKLEAECDTEFDCIPEEDAGACCADAADAEDCADSATESDTVTDTVDGSCCTDGVCSFSPEEETTTDQPAQIHMDDPADSDLV